MPFPVPRPRAVRRPRTSLVFLALVYLAMPRSTLDAQSSFDALARQITTFTLKNGMQFIVLERHESPVASFLTYADVGDAQDPKGQTGIAHLFEHMAFKGSRHIGATNIPQERLALDAVDRAFLALREERRKGRRADPEKVKELEATFTKAQEDAGKYVTQNEFDDVIERAGGRNLNASTSEDATNYYFSLPSNAIELWFYLESERFLDPVLREFYKEKNVVMEERRLRVESRPIGKLIEEFLSVAYKAHPYGISGVGHMTDLQSISRADAEAFFKSHYTPRNLIGVVVGDVDPARVRQLAELYFGRLPNRPRPDPLDTVEPPQEGERRVTLQLQAQRLIVIGYHKPNINDPDNAAYEAIGGLLSEGRSSRLYRSLVRDKQIAVQTGGFSGFPGEKYPGLFVFYAFVAPGKTNDDAEKALDQEIARLTTTVATAEELEGVKRRARANLMRSLDDNSQMALQLSSWQALTGDWRNLFRQLDRIDAVTPQDIQRVAKKTFTRANRTVGLIEPAGPDGNQAEVAP
jgi:predicted Zn-dependent peptidase